MWRKDGTGIAIEVSPDMVPGMLYSRLRPGMNHIAFHVDIGRGARPAGRRRARLRVGPARARRRAPSVAPGTTAAFVEDGDGFEVELIAPDDA